MGPPRLSTSLFRAGLFRATFASAAEGRRNNFDFLRFVLASLVLLYHCFALLPPGGPGRGGTAERAATLAGGAGVDFFFVISGFLVTMSRQRSPGVWPFLRRRALRIYPGFFLASAACALLVGPLGADSASLYWHHFRLLKFALYLFLLPADVVGPDVAHVFTRLPYPKVMDGSFWTLRYEFEMYLLTAALGAAGLLLRGREVWVGALFVLLYCLLAVSQVTSLMPVPAAELPWVGSPSAWLRLSACYLSGAAFCLYRDRVPSSPALLGLSLLVLLAAARRDEWFSAALPLFGSYALFSFAFQPRVRLQGLARWGDFSYGMYLYAFPIQQLLIQSAGAHLTPALLFAAAFPPTLACAAVSWHLVERPCLGMRGK